jgi:hypothetical protein
VVRGVAQDVERQLLLVDEVDEPALGLVAVERAHGVGGAGEHPAHVGLEVGAQARVARVRAGRADDVVAQARVGLRRRQLGEPGPRRPRQRVARAQHLGGLVDHRDGLERALRQALAAGGRQVGARALDRVLEGGVEVLGGGALVRRVQQREQAGERVLGGALQVVGAEAVGARLVDELVQLVAPALHVSARES